jgi:hypothetical protein
MFLKDFKSYCASGWILFVVVIADARNHEPEMNLKNVNYISQQPFH